MPLNDYGYGWSQEDLEAMLARGYVPNPDNPGQFIPAQQTSQPAPAQYTIADLQNTQFQNQNVLPTNNIVPQTTTPPQQTQPTQSPAPVGVSTSAIDLSKYKMDEESGVLRVLRDDGEGGTIWGLATPEDREAYQLATRQTGLQQSTQGLQLPQGWTSKV